MVRVKVKIDWCNKNWAAVTNDEQLCGMVIVTAKTYDALIKELRDGVAEHVMALKEENEDVPQWLEQGDYEFEIEFGTAALIRRAEQFTTLAAISRATGINQTLLTHYATGLKQPREKQRSRIVDGLHRIGETFLSIN